MFYVVVTVLGLLQTSLAVEGFEPCSNYTLLTYVDRRAVRNVLDLEKINSISDDFLHTGWYRIDSRAGEDMPTQPPGSLHCGAWYPIWLNGSLPSFSGEQISGRVCLQSFNDECELSWNIDIKFCAGNFFVYKLITSNISQSGYCFGTEVLSMEVDQTTTTSAPAAANTSFDPCFHYNMMQYEEKRPTSNIFQFENDNDVAISDDFLTTGWFRIKRKTCENMPTMPPGSLHCGTWYPIWLKGTIPNIVGLQVKETVCLQSFTNNCSYSWSIDIKSCPGNFLVYHLPASSIAFSGYCFGSAEICAETPIEEVKTTTSATEPDYKKQENKSITLTIVLIVTITVAVLVLVIFMAVFCQKSRRNGLLGQLVGDPSANNVKLKNNKTRDSPPPYSNKPVITSIPPMNHKDNPPPYRSREPSVASLGSFVADDKRGTPVDIFTINGDARQK